MIDLPKEELAREMETNRVLPMISSDREREREAEIREEREKAAISCPDGERARRRMRRRERPELYVDGKREKKTGPADDARFYVWADIEVPPSPIVYFYYRNGHWKIGMRLCAADAFL